MDETYVGEVLNEKEIAAKSVQIVVTGSKRGVVSLCADVAQLLRNNSKLQARVIQLEREVETLQLQNDLRETHKALAIPYDSKMRHKSAANGEVKSARYIKHGDPQRPKQMPTAKIYRKPVPHAPSPQQKDETAPPRPKSTEPATNAAASPTPSASDSGVSIRSPTQSTRSLSPLPLTDEPLRPKSATTVHALVHTPPTTAASRAAQRTTFTVEGEIQPRRQSYALPASQSRPLILKPDGDTERKYLESAERLSVSSLGSGGECSESQSSVVIDVDCSSAIAHQPEQSNKTAQHQAQQQIKPGSLSQSYSTPTKTTLPGTAVPHTATSPIRTSAPSSLHMSSDSQTRIIRTLTPTTNLNSEELAHSLASFIPTSPVPPPPPTRGGGVDTRPKVTTRTLDDSSPSSSSTSGVNSPASLLPRSMSEAAFDPSSDLSPRPNFPPAPTPRSNLASPAFSDCGVSFVPRAPAGTFQTIQSGPSHRHASGAASPQSLPPQPVLSSRSSLSSDRSGASSPEREFDRTMTDAAAAAAAAVVETGPAVNLQQGASHNSQTVSDPHNVIVANSRPRNPIFSNEPMITSTSLHSRTNPYPNTSEPPPREAPPPFPQGPKNMPRSGSKQSIKGPAAAHKFEMGRGGPIDNRLPANPHQSPHTIGVPTHGFNHPHRINERLKIFEVTPDSESASSTPPLAHNERLFMKNSERL